MRIPFGNWIIPSQDFGEVCPVFRRRFRLSGKLNSAGLCMTALGLYEARLNGKLIGDQVFAPGWTSYRKRLQFQEYDITDLLEEENELTITLGKGWAVDELTWDRNTGYGSDTAAILADIRLKYMDGTSESIVTDKDWEAAKTGILESHIYDGEVFDSRITPENWIPCQLFDYPKEQLIPQEGDPIREVEVLRPEEIITTPKGETVIDFGQNMTGYVQFTITGPEGHKAVVSHAEVLDRDGNFYTANLRSAKEQITFYCNGETVTYKPHFTFQGFRYIRLENWPEEVKKENFTALAVHSDMKRIGHFECSEPLINQLYKNIIWGQRGNFLDVPTDCPQRDERLGWTGDAQVFIRAASYNYDVNRFFTKWLHDLKADQYPDGEMPAVIPDVLSGGVSEGHGSNSAAWGDAATVCPWQLYLSYGNRQILEDQFDSMRKWVEYIRRQGDNEYLWNTGEHYGDWLGLDAAEGSYKGATDEGLIATAYFAYSTSLLIKAGHVLERDMTEYETLYQGIRKAFQETYLKDGVPMTDTQTARVLALYFDLCDNPKEMAAGLARLVEQNGNRLSTGFVGTPYLLHALSDHGYAELAYSLLLQEEFPSWLYSVKAGATTIWEHWDGMRPDGTMWSTDMNSFNHYAYGAVADWMYGVMAGIRPCEDKPGYEHIILNPIPDKRISYVKASLDTKYGTITSSWKKENGKVVYEFEVPHGCTADIILEGNQYTVIGGKHSYKI